MVDKKGLRSDSRPSRIGSKLKGALLLANLYYTVELYFEEWKLPASIQSSLQQRGPTLPAP